MERNLSESRLKLFFIILYAFIISVTIYFHECWRDEWLAILVSIQSHSVYQFFYLLSLEQHPPLWYLLIKIAWFIYPHIASVKILHILISLTSAYVLLYKIKYSFYYRVAFLFSYFLLYEYTIISRNYGLVILFGLIAVVQLQKDNKNYWILFGSLSCMALSHVYGLLISFSLCLYCLLINSRNYKNLSFIVCFSSYIILSFAVCIILKSHSHPVVTSAQINPLRIIRAVYTGTVYLWNSFIPIPQFNTGFWNTNFMSSAFSQKLFLEVTIGNVLKLVLFIPLLYFILKPFFKAPQFIISLLIAWLLFMLLQGLALPGYLRHWGFYFISFMFFVFLSEKEMPLLKYFLSANIIASLFAIYMEITYPFTNAEKVVDFIKRQPTPCAIATNEYVVLSCITGLLEQPIYYTGENKKLFFIDWNNYYKLAGRDIIDPAASLHYLKEKIKKEKIKEGILILRTSIDENKEFIRLLPSFIHSLSVKEFSGSISGEDFWLIIIKEN